MSTPSTAQPDAHELELEAAQAAPASLHAPFLERSADPDSEDSAHALGAFLTLRVIDQFANPTTDTQALAHQIRASLQYLQDLQPATQEVQHLTEIARAAATACQIKAARAIWAPIGNYAAWLEGQIRLAEALDVLDTGLRAAGGGDDSVAAMSIQLQRGRVLRLSSRADEATKAYAAAGNLAAKNGDTHTELLSRIGRGIVQRQLGNLPAAASTLRAVHADAVKIGDRDAQARALHDLAATKILQGNHSAAVNLGYQAFEAYEDSDGKRRALSDLGLAFKELGCYRAASDAFELVLRCNPPAASRVSAMLEQLHLAALTRDRVSFERLRRELGRVLDRMLPLAQIDFQLHVGLGLKGFGRLKNAQSHLEEAARLAELYNFNEHLFRAEAALAGVDEDHDKQVEENHLPSQQIEADSGEVREVADELHALLVGA